MSTSWSTFKSIILFLCSLPLCLSASANAQGEGNELPTEDTKCTSSLRPSSFNAHFAGGTGVFALGVGWSYGKKNQWETDLLLGYIPQFNSGHSHGTFTIKENYVPWSKNINEHFSWNPLTTSIYLVSISGDEYWGRQPDKYEKDYYFFSTKIRVNLSIGQRFTYKIPSQKPSFIKSITGYYELATCDIYVMSAFNNHYLKPWDYISLAFGFRINI